MSDSRQTPVVLEKPLAPGKMALQPTFFGALRGIWLFTWRSNLTLARVPVLLLSLLVLPVLVYLTVATAQAWSKRQRLMGSPERRIAELENRLNKVGKPLTPAQKTELSSIFHQEFRRAEETFSSTEVGKLSVNRQREQIRATYDRIDDRCRTVLDEAQFPIFESAQRQSFERAEMQVRDRRWSRAEPFYHWLIDFFFFVILPLNCVRACGGLIRDELQADTLGFLTTRPLTRARLVLVKYLTQTTWLQILMLVETLLLFAVGALRDITQLGSLLLLFLFAQFLAIFAWGALGALLGLATKRYMAVALLYGLVVEMGIGRIPTNINNLSLIRQFKSLLGRDSALQAIYNWDLNSLPYCIGVVVLATCVFLTVAAVLFTVLEYLHTVEMQK